MKISHILALLMTPLKNSNGKFTIHADLANECIEMRPTTLHKILLITQREAIKQFHLEYVDVDYCCFGRGEQKTTRLWTNSRGLVGHLGWFRCRNCCTQGKLHVPVRGNTGNFNFSAIPMPLAEEVSRFVHAELYLQRVQRTKALSPLAA